MSQEHAENRRYKQQLACLTALAPKYLALDDLKQVFSSLQNPSVSSAENARQFNNVALLNSDGYRAEIIYNVDKVLEKYEGDFLAPLANGHLPNAKVEKELLWASLQLFAYLQAIEQEVGLILDPNSEYLQTFEKLQICQQLLRKNGSDMREINTLVASAPVIVDAQSGKWYEKLFKDCIDYIDARNNTRLFWVWGRPNLDLALEYAGQSEARARLSNTTYLPGQISWSLYLLRGSVFAIKMFNKWWNNPVWLKKLQESGLTAEEYTDLRRRYLIAYWNVYKYRILNDYVWGPINLFCFKWWVGTGFPGWFGDFATCFLLCMDIYLADLTYTEEQKKYLDTQEQYQKNEKKLTKLILNKVQNGVKKKLLEKDSNFDGLKSKEKIKVLLEYLAERNKSNMPLKTEELELVDLARDLAEAQQDQIDLRRRWENKEKFLRCDCYYTKALLFVFAMAVAFLAGGILPAALAAFLTKSGTVWCLGLTILYRTARDCMEIAQKKADRAELIKREEQLIAEFLTAKSTYAKDNSPINLKKMHDLYLTVVKTGEHINYQTASIKYRWLELARTTLLRFSIPTLLGLTLVYAPATIYMVPTYVFVLLASAAFAYALDQWAKQYKPDSIQHKPTFEEGKYRMFYNAPKQHSQPIDNSIFCVPYRFGFGTTTAN